MRIKNTLILIILLIFSAGTHAKNISPEDLIEVQLTKKSMEIGIKAAISNGCIQNGKSLQVCADEISQIDKLDFDKILKKVYLEAYSQKQINDLYQFYSSEAGKKYSQGMLSMVTKQVQYHEIFEMPELSKEEEKLIKEFQASEVSKMEAEAKPRLQEAINKYLISELQRLGTKR
jgi:Uncharacterized protein conserved in bacteria (DUF2059)